MVTKEEVLYLLSKMTKKEQEEYLEHLRLIANKK